jgi:hypothetical protein
MNYRFAEILLLPQTAIDEMSEENILAENILTASLLQTTYKLSLAQSSFYTFSVFCLVTFAWCLVRLVPTIFMRSPILSSFEEVNFASKLSGDNRIGMLCKLGPDATSITVEKMMGDVDIFITKADGGRRDDEYQLDNLN